MLYSQGGNIQLSITDLQNQLSKHTDYNHFEHWLEGAL